MADLGDLGISSAECVETPIPRVVDLTVSTLQRLVGMDVHGCPVTAGHLGKCVIEYRRIGSSPRRRRVRILHDPSTVYQNKAKICVIPLGIP